MPLLCFKLEGKDRVCVAQEMERVSMVLRFEVTIAEIDCPLDGCWLSFSTAAAQRKGYGNISKGDWFISSNL